MFDNATVALVSLVADCARAADAALSDEIDTLRDDVATMLAEAHADAAEAYAEQQSEMEALDNRTNMLSGISRHHSAIIGNHGDILSDTLRLLEVNGIADGSAMGAITGMAEALTAYILRTDKRIADMEIRLSSQSDTLRLLNHENATLRATLDRAIVAGILRA